MTLEYLKAEFKQLQDRPDTLEIRLYGEVKGDSYNYYTGEAIKSKTGQDYFVEQLEAYKNVKEIILYINSCGGSVEQGYGIYANLRRHPAHKTCYVDGFANSIASIIAMACDKIVMYSNSMMGIHNAMTICIGNACELRKAADDLDKLMEGNREIYLNRANGKITLEQLTDLLDAETMLTAKECLDFGFCDEIDEGKQADANAIQTATRQFSQSMTIAGKSLEEANRALEATRQKRKDDSKEIDLYECIIKSFL